MTEKIVLDGRRHYEPSRALQRVLQDDCALRMLVWVLNGVTDVNVDDWKLKRSMLEAYVEAEERGELTGEMFRGVRWSSMTAKRARIILGLKRCKTPRKK